MSPRQASKDNTVQTIQLTPMIDIVFQLLIFFILTFRIVASEGDFNLQAPAVGSVSDAGLTTPTLKVKLESHPDGQLASIQLNGQPISNWWELQNRVIELVEHESSEPYEVVLDCDDHLKYEHVIEAVTAVSGYRQDDEIITLIENISLAP